MSRNAQIDMWDVSRDDCPRLLRSIEVNQGMGYAVSYVRFLADPTCAVYGDTSGSVFQLTFKRGITGRTTDSECFFSGSRGEILCLEPLLLIGRQSDHPLAEHNLLAMASFTKVIVVSCRSVIKVEFMRSLKGAGDSLPQLAWSHNSRLLQLLAGQQSCRDAGQQPLLLTFARDSQVSLVMVQAATDHSDPSPLFTVVWTLSLPLRVLALKWLNQFILGVLDMDEQFHAVDIVTKSIIETIDVRSVQLVYNTSLLRSTATGGQVSEAMSAAAERACYHSVVASGGQVKLIGNSNSHMLMLRHWTELIDVTVVSGHDGTAVFRLCDSLYRGPEHSSEARAVLQLPSDEAERERLVAKRARAVMEERLREFMYADQNTVHDVALAGNRTVTGDVWQGFFGAILDLCVTTHQIDYFCEGLPDQLTAAISAGVDASAIAAAECAYLQALLPLVEAGGAISQLHPGLVQRIVQYLLHRDPGRLDRLLARLDICCLDIDYVVRVAAEHKLFRTLVHVHNEALKDFVAPLRAMLDFVAIAADDVNVEEIVMAAIVYCHRCLSSSTVDDVQIVQKEIFEYLVPFSSSTVSASLRELLQHNPSELLNMLTLVFGEPFFTDPELGASRKQALISKMCTHFCDPQPEQQQRKSGGVVHFLVFVGRELCEQQQERRDSAPVSVDAVVLQELVERACETLQQKTGGKSSSINGGQGSRYSVLHRQTETALLQLLASEAGLDIERVLMLSRRAGLYRVCESIYRTQGKLHLVLETYLLDREYKEKGYEFLDSVWHDESMDEKQRSAISKKCFELAEHLVRASPHLGVVVLLTVCKRRLEEVVQQLSQSPPASPQSMGQPPLPAVFLFLQAFFHIRGEVEESGSHLCDDVAASVAAVVAVDLREVRVAATTAELFIQLLCVHSEGVSTLHWFLGHSVDYRSDVAVQIVRRHGPRLSSEVGFLLERARQFQEAAALYIELLDQQWTRSRDQEPASSELLLRGPLVQFVTLVARHRARCASTEKNSLWPLMLERILAKFESGCTEDDKAEVKSLLASFIKTLSLNTDISASTVLSHIIKNPIFQRHGQVRSLFLSLARDCMAEGSLLAAGLAVVGRDIRRQLGRGSSRMGNVVVAAAPGGGSAVICAGCSLSTTVGMDMEALYCGHWLHSGCLLEAGDCPQCVSSGQKSMLSSVQVADMSLSPNSDLSSLNIKLPSESSYIREFRSLPTPPRSSPHRSNDSGYIVASSHAGLSSYTQLNVAAPNFLASFQVPASHLPSPPQPTARAPTSTSTSTTTSGY